MTNIRIPMLVMALALVLVSSIVATVPQMINYQGRLTDPSGDPVPNNNYNMVLRIWDHPTSGSLQWQEPHSGVSVTDGMFSVTLGSSSPIPLSVLEKSQLYLSIEVGGQTINPRTRLVSSLYALSAETANSASSIVGGVDKDDIVDEPGLAAGFNDDIIFQDQAITDLCQVQITIPEDGFIFVQASGYLIWQIINDDEFGAYYQINDSPEANMTQDHWYRVYFEYMNNPGSYVFYEQPISASRVYSKPAGTYTFYFTALEIDNPYRVTAKHARIYAVYFPTSYGSVSSMTQHPVGQP